MSGCVVEAEVPAAPAAVFEQWATAERLAAWWWPMFPDAGYRMDLRPGGRWGVDAPAMGFGVRGMVTEVVPSERIAFTWHWEGAGASGVADVEDHVIVELMPTGSGTTVRVTHVSNESLDDGGIEQGWRDVLARLARVSGGG